MTSPQVADELNRLKAERELYRRLLELGHQTEPEPFLRDALALIVELAEAKHGYLELYEEGDAEPRWWMAHGFSGQQIDGVRSKLSSGIIARAVATGETLVTPSAMLDPRFSEFDSVQLGKIEAVLCTPVGGDPVRGILYLQGRERPGLFTREEREDAEIFARHLAQLAQRLLSERRRRDTVDATRELRAKLRLDGMIGRSAAFAATLKDVSLVAPLEVSVLLRGAGGTGKTQMAHLIHDNGPRARGPFVELNCAALPEALVESELFGAFPGAYTGATHRILGKVAAAEGGSLFLDEIAELTPATQAKLLQLLNSKEYYPLGSASPVRADIRLLAATNADLEQAVRDKRFREDLYFRLKVVQLRCPSLSERREDIRALLVHFCTLAAERNKLPRLELSPGALRAAEAAAWPGNIRELANCAEAALIRAAGEEASQVQAHHLFPEAEVGAVPERAKTFQEATRTFQAALLHDTLEELQWNVVEAAKRLDLARSHVYNLIKAFGLERRR